MKIKKWLLSIAIFLMIFSSACSEKKKGITVAVAANVQYAFQEIKASFIQKTGIKVDATITSSGKLTAQIKNGAPFDIFLSANMKYPLTLFDSGYAIHKPRVYAQGSLVLWTLTMDNLSADFSTVILSDKVSKIALANPKNAPYGMAAIEVLRYHNIHERVKQKLIYAETISQVNQYIVSKSVDLGFTAKSVVLSPKMKGKGTWFEMAKKSYNPIEQGVVILKHGQQNHPDESKQFYDFLFSQKAKKIFKEYGYDTDTLN